jgi:cytochrome c-type biogenesis protein CcmF
VATLGEYLLLAAFITCAYAIAVSVAGARRRSQKMVESGVGAFYLIAAIMTVASTIIVYAFVAGDYSIKYVERYSDSSQPLFYKLTAYWGGLDGSIMFWVFMLSLFGSAAVFLNKERHRELTPYVVAVIAAVQMFFLLLMVVHNNPFETYLTEIPLDGQGLNPLLQNFYMVIHPPTMYLGFVGLTIPFAFCMAALITGHLDDSWLRAVRRWTMGAWFLLSLGLVLGMLWAYEELGWGGYWGWDPVENAALLPWFTATAFLHSVMVQERRGMLRIWNVTLIIITFFLTIFGTFMTRSGIVQSVHAFGQDDVLAGMFIVFMVVLLTFSFGWVIYRLPLLRARNEFDSWISREAAFLVNNWILLFAAMFVLFATMFPTITEALTGERLTMGPPFFNQWMLPIGLMLLALTGVGPLLAWRKSTIINLLDQFLFPVVLGLVVGGTVLALGVRVWSSGLCFALSGFVVGTLSQEVWRGTRVRQGVSGSDFFTALVGLTSRNNRRYGGYVVHLGIVVMALGFAGEGFKIDEQVLMQTGQQIEVGPYLVRHDALRVTNDAQKQMVTAQLSIFKDGEAVGQMFPARWYFRNFETEPTTEVAIRRSFADDLYLVLPAFDLQNQSVTLSVVVNPLVNWVWFGFALLAFGTGFSMLPETVFRRAMAQMPAGATASLLLFALALAPVPAAAQTGPLDSLDHVVTDDTIPLSTRTPLEREIGREIICMCGTCVRELAGECDCSTASAMRDEIRMLVDSGLSKPQILEFYVAKYGSQQVLAAPIDRGFNRLAWAVPYFVGLMAFGGIVLTARRWSRSSVAVPGGDAGIDPELSARLDDELRDLD